MASQDKGGDKNKKDNRRSLDDAMRKYGDRFSKAFDQSKNDETVYGQSEVPPGIENGRASLENAYFGVYETGDYKGELFFRASGVILWPEEHNDESGMPVTTQGLHTSIGPEPLCDTPGRTRGTMEEHVKWINNELRKLGIETSGKSLAEMKTDLESLNEIKPVFKFRTWKGKKSKQYPNPKTNHQWQGLADFDEESMSAGEQDDTEPAEETPQPVAPPKSKEKPPAQAKDPARPKAKTPAKPKAPEPEPEPEEPEFNEFNEQEEDTDDLDSLAERAQDDDDEAIDRLKTIAKEAGISPKIVKDADTWTDVVALIKEKRGDTEEPSEESTEEPEEAPPSVGDVLKTNIGGKMVSVRVESVNTAKKTCKVSTLKDKKPQKDPVPFSELKPAV